MATVQAIKELLIRARSEGVDKVAADLTKVAAAQKQVADASALAAKVTEDATRSQVSVAKAFDRTVASIDPTFRAFQQMSRAQATFDRALAQGVISNDQYAASMSRLQTRYGALGAANNNLLGQTGNLAAQFNDIAVQLAGGTSPFLIAMQQGTQIAQVLGDSGGGARGAVKALGGAFLSLISPVNLLTIGAIAFGGTLIQYLSGAGQETEKLDDKLKAHSDLIRGIASAYGEAGKGLEEYAAQSGAVLEGQLRAQTERLRADLQRLMAEMVAARSTVIGPAFTDPGSGAAFGGVDTKLDPKYAAFQRAVEQLDDSIARGQPNIRAYREEIARIMRESADSTSIQSLGAELLRGSDNAAKVEAALNKAAQAIRLASGAAGDGVGNLKDFNSALAALSNIALPNRTDQQKALLEYRKAFESAGGREDRAAAQAAYDSALQRAAERDAEKAAEKAQREAEAEAKRREQTWARGKDRIEDQIRALEQQAVTFGMSTGEAARYRAEQELINAAMEAQIPLTSDLQKWIQSTANRAGEAAESLERVRQAAEWSDLGRDTLGGFISDLRQGKSAADAFASALERIADRLLDMTLNSLFNGGETPIVGFFNALRSGGSGGSAPAYVPMAKGGYGPELPAQAFAGIGKLPEVISSAVEPITKAVNTSLTAAAQAIRTIESGSATGNYGALGPLTRSGDRAYGAYQVMGNNVGPWTEQHFGQRLNPTEFLNNRAAQDAVFNGEFGRLMSKYGPEGASRAWFAGERGMSNWNARDAVGTSVGGYNSRFGDLYQRYNNGPQAFNGSAGNDNLAGGMGQDMQQLSGSFDTLSQSMTSATPQITQSLTGLGSITQQGGDMVGTALEGTASTIGQGANGIGQAISQLGNSLSQGGGGGGLGGLFSMFGGGGGASWGGMPMSSWTLPDMSGVSFGFHSGGLVGRDHSFKRYIHPTYYDDAPRYHSGLRPDEVPAILQKGEWVLSKDDVAGIRSAGKGGAAGGVTVNHTVVDNAGTKVEHETRQNPDGSIDIMTIIDERAKGAIRKDAQRNGPTSRQLGAGFNGRG